MLYLAVSIEKLSTFIKLVISVLLEEISDAHCILVTVARSQAFWPARGQNFTIVSHWCCVVKLIFAGWKLLTNLAVLGSTKFS